MAFWSILKLDCRPCGMELFGSVAASSWDHIREVIDGADVLVLIVGDRRGSLRPDGKSFTEHEFDYAISKNKPVLWFWRNAKKGKKATPTSSLGNCDEQTGLEAFREKCRSFQGSEWSSEGELLELITSSLSKLLLSGKVGPRAVKTAPQMGQLQQTVHITDVPGIRSLHCRHVRMPFPGRQTVLTWAEFGIAFNELQDLLKNHSTHLRASVLVGLNETGLGIAGLLQESLFNGKKSGYIRVDNGRAKIEFFPKITQPTHLLLVDFEIRTGSNLATIMKVLQPQLPEGCTIDFACFGAQSKFIGDSTTLHFDDLDCADMVRASCLRRIFFTLVAEDPSIAPPT